MQGRENLLKIVSDLRKNSSQPDHDRESLLRGWASLLCALCRLACAAYVGGWILLLGGIADFVNGLSSSESATSRNTYLGAWKIFMALPAAYIIIQISYSIAVDVARSASEKANAAGQEVDSDE